MKKMSKEGLLDWLSDKAKEDAENTLNVSHYYDNIGYKELTKKMNSMTIYDVPEAGDVIDDMLSAFDEDEITESERDRMANILTDNFEIYDDVYLETFKSYPDELFSSRFKVIVDTMQNIKNIKRKEDEYSNFLKLHLE